MMRAKVRLRFFMSFGLYFFLFLHLEIIPWYWPSVSSLTRPILEIEAGVARGGTTAKRLLSEKTDQRFVPSS